MVRMHKLARLRNLVIAIVLGTGATGCSFAHWSLFHCDDCDDFPMPGYGPGYTMMPGTYGGDVPRDSHESSQRALAPAGQPVPPGSPTTPPGGTTTPPGATTTPPAPPPAAAPAPGAPAGPGAGPMTSLDTTPTEALPALPAVPGLTRSDLQVPAASPSADSSVR